MRISPFKKVQCQICGEKGVLTAQAIGVCPECIRKAPEKTLSMVQDAHAQSRRHYGLLPSPPKDKGVLCNQCANQCKIPEGQTGYCGVRINNNGKLVSKAGENKAYLHTYLDSLPTNCCASYFCPGTQRGELNLAAFLYSCSFNCLFCQNSSHKALSSAPVMHINQVVRQAEKNDKITCICWFGGSPEPQLPFALEVSQIAYEKIAPQRNFRVCWEWNGGGNPSLVKKALNLALESGGNAKFDLKCFSPILSKILLGVENKRSFENFRMCAEEFYDQRSEPVLTATTLLVPGYVDDKEVEFIAKFIADLNPSIPYSLLVFHPDWMLSDLPYTPRNQVEKCYQAAKKYLEQVHIGNKRLLGLSF
ncbi:MAG: radical SAM protein [Candidatus Hodarchaeota archaeon]